MKYLKKFRQNRNGLAYIWGVCACVIAFFPLIYWILSVYLDNIATSVFGMYTFLGATASAWTLAKAIISALPLFVLVTLVLWASVNAKAQAYEQ